MAVLLSGLGELTFYVVPFFRSRFATPTSWLFHRVNHVKKFPRRLLINCLEFLVDL